MKSKCSVSPTEDDRQEMPGNQDFLPGCDICGQPAVYFDRCGGRHLCRTHLTADVEERVLSAIAKYDMIRDGDRIAVGLSGGKDSSALLFILSKIIPGNYHASLIAITVDEGIEGYREETVHSAVALTKRLGIAHTIVSFESLYGCSLDTILRRHDLNPCTACGILRKKALSDAAKHYGAHTIATGHNLDDEAQSVLMNYLRGDLDRLIRSSSARNTGFIGRIKPFLEVSEKVVTLYGIIMGLSGNLPECPYARSSLRSEVRSMQSALEYSYPGSSLRLVHGQQFLSEKVKTMKTGENTITRCRTCGEPCSGDICQACRLIASLGNNPVNNPRFKK